MKLIHVRDRGSRPRRAQVQIGGVLAWGIVDSGADITIIGKDLLQTIAAVSKLRKRDCKNPDKVPRTYDRKPFTLHGMLELEISFAEKKMRTKVYIKMDTSDQLLLSEGVCRQLGIIRYHPSVRPSSEEQQEGEEARESMGRESPEDTAVVPTVRVQLLQSVTVPPLQRLAVEVKVDSDAVSSPLLLVTWLEIVAPARVRVVGVVQQRQLPSRSLPYRIKKIRKTRETTCYPTLTMGV